MTRHKIQILPKEAQEQLLLMTDKNSTMYNRQHAEDPLVKRAIEELIKKKIVIQANHAQQLYG